MSCNDSCNTNQATTKVKKCNDSMSYVIILVLYILLAIIIGSCLFS